MAPPLSGNNCTSILGLALAVLLALAPLREVCAEEPPFTPVIGYTSSTFTYQAQENVEAAARIWSTLVIRKKHGAAETIRRVCLSSTESFLKEYGALKSKLEKQRQ